MRIGLSDITAASVDSAISEFDRLGRSEFLHTYGFGQARTHYLVHQGRQYDSKAIVGVAHMYERPGEGQLRHDEFFGGAPTTSLLRRLGFTVISTDSPSRIQPRRRNEKHWWTGNDSERFWLESTDRDDLGTNLHAPKLDDAGKENPKYDLFRFSRPGDIVFHYHKKPQAVIAWSVVGGPIESATILWGARGHKAKKRGATAYVRPSWRMPLSDLTYLTQPLSLDELRRTSDSLRAIRDDLSAQFNLTTYFPFELSHTRPVRPLPGYIFKLPKAVVDRYQVLIDAASIVDGNPILGSDYRPSSETGSRKHPVPPTFDPDLVDRGSRAHGRIQKAVADFLRSQGLSPRSPRPSEPLYDISWSADDQIWVAEVKSLTFDNEERQLRLGLGQLLRYRQQMSSIHHQVQAALIIERQPTDPGWLTLCESLDVILVWPGELGPLIHR